MVRVWNGLAGVAGYGALVDLHVMGKGAQLPAVDSVPMALRSMVVGEVVSGEYAALEKKSVAIR